MIILKKKKYKNATSHILHLQMWEKFFICKRSCSKLGGYKQPKRENGFVVTQEATKKVTRNSFQQPFWGTHIIKIKVEIPVLRSHGFPHYSSSLLSNYSGRILETSYGSISALLRKKLKPINFPSSSEKRPFWKWSFPGVRKKIFRSSFRS